MDFSTRAIDHLHYDMDPIVRSRLDNDFYKFLMRQQIHLKHPNTIVQSTVTNRTLDVRLADIIPIDALREQLEYAQTLRYEQKDLIYMKGNSFYGQDDIFSPNFIHSLKTSSLTDFELSADNASGQFTLRTEGKWEDATDWEMIFMTITNEMRNREIMRGLTPAEIEITYARAKSKLYSKLEKIIQYPELTISDFGTRRRHSFLWQKWVVEMMIEVLGDQFVGTSNTYLARELGVEAIGTNAHELPMVYAAIASAQADDEDRTEALIQSQYDVLKDWSSIYGDNLRIFLPDTFGTTQFLERAPNWIQWWDGARPDSKDPAEAAVELNEFWRSKGQNPEEKKIIFSDGLDVKIDGYETNGTDMIEIHNRFHGKCIDTYGLGTMGTNDFIGCVPHNPDLLKAISIVCKVTKANGHPTVKISDNPAKAMSVDKNELDIYLEAFGSQGIGDERKTVV